MRLVRSQTSELKALDRMKTSDLTVIGLVIQMSGMFWVASAVAEERTFTSADGRTISASLISATETQVTIKRADGREFTLDLVKLIEADQEAIKKWRTENPEAAAPKPAKGPLIEKLEAEFKIDKKKSGSRKLGKDKEEEKWLYEVEMSNRARTPLPQLTVKYELFIRYYSKYTDPKRGVARVVPGEYLLKGLGAQEKIVFQTSAATTMTDKSRELNGDIVTSTHYVEDLEGVLIKFFQGEKEVGEYKHGKVQRE